MVRIAVTGATGFIGRAVISAIRTTGASVTGLYRDLRRDAMAVESVKAVEGTLAEAKTLDRFVDGADIVVHAASYVGADEDQQHEVNITGTASLLGAAQAANVRRIIYVSTAGVYGKGFPHESGEAGAAPQPRSPLSKSRHIAEQGILEAGGTVVRPNIVVGAGDRWFAPPLLRAMFALDAWIENGDARVSLIDVNVLGTAIATLSTQWHEPGIYHAANLRPTRIRDVVTPLYDAMGRSLPARSVGWSEALALLASHGATPTQIAIVGADNWFNAEKLWRTVGCQPKETPLLSPKAIQWYTREVEAFL